MIEKIYKNSIVEKPKFTLSILFIILISFSYFAKDFQLDASSDTLLLENDPDLKYLREVNEKYKSKDYLVLTYSPKKELLHQNKALNIRYNYPYLGKADGFTTYLRKQFPTNYMGIEIEVNQKFATENRLDTTITKVVFDALKATK